VVHGPAGVPAGGDVGGAAADDGGQLYAFNDTFGNNVFFWVGIEWFEQTLSDSRMWDALKRQLIFSSIILAIQIPLGIAIALCMPKKGIWASVCLVLMALPLLIPWNVVGTIWQVFARVDIGLLGYTLGPRHQLQPTGKASHRPGSW
jgi:glycerol transport system permease protein